METRQTSYRSLLKEAQKHLSLPVRNVMEKRRMIFVGISNMTPKTIKEAVGLAHRLEHLSDPDALYQLMSNVLEGRPTPLPASYVWVEVASQLTNKNGRKTSKTERRTIKSILSFGYDIDERLAALQDGVDEFVSSRGRVELFDPPVEYGVAGACPAAATIRSWLVAYKQARERLLSEGNCYI